MRKKKVPIDMITGSKFDTNEFGALKIVEYSSSLSVFVEFLETGYKTTARADHIRGGRVKDKIKPIMHGIGFVGDGEHGTRGEMTKIYQCWKNMIIRCYSTEEQKRRPSYVGCSVCCDWHNYQNFARWYLENLPKESGKYELDKDIKFDGNKIYSPDTCLIVTQDKNKEKAKAKTHEYISPEGCKVKIYNLKKFCRENDLHRGHMCEVAIGKRKSHKGWRI